MALKFQVDSLDDLDENTSAQYRATDDGKFVLSLDGIDDHFVPKSEWKKINDESATRRHQLAAWKKLGETPEKVAEALETQKQLAAQAGDGAAILKQKQDEWAAEKTSMESEINASRTSERSAIVGERLNAALAKAGATEEGLELLPDRLGNRIKFETVNGKRVIKIMKADGETPMAGNGEGGTATLDDLVKETMKKYPSSFRGTGAGGGGKLPNENGGGGSGATKKSDFKTEKERAAFFEKHGKAAYDALPA